MNTLRSSPCSSSSWGPASNPACWPNGIAAQGDKVVLLDRNPDRLASVEAMGLPFVEGDAIDLGVWPALEPELIRAVAVMLPDDETSLEVSRLARTELDIKRVIARLQDVTLTRRFTDLGVRVVSPSLSPIVELEYLLLYPSVSSLMADLEDEHDVAEVRLTCSELANRPLRDLDLPEGVMVVLVRRNGDVIYPRGDTQLQLGDRLTLIGSLTGARELVRHCQRLP
jgi:Trk K+ transport system NAD-binding subunit